MIKFDVDALNAVLNSIINKLLHIGVLLPGQVLLAEQQELGAEHTQHEICLVFGFKRVCSVDEGVTSELRKQRSQDILNRIQLILIDGEGIRTWS